jgi:mRNA interferase YafQ
MRVLQTSQFKKDLRNSHKRGKDLQKLKEVIDALVSLEPLPPKQRDHVLAGKWLGWRECHLAPDWLLIYKRCPDELVLGRTGSHSDLF